MKIELFSYIPQQGWSSVPLPVLDSEQTLVLLFCAPQFIDSPEPIAYAASVFPKSHLIGCSTAGEIFGNLMRDGSLSGVAVKFDHTRLAVASAPVHASNDSFNAGQSIGTALKRNDLRAVFVLSEGNHVNGSDLVRGLSAMLPPEVIITGGLAGDGERFKRTWIVHEGKPQTDRVVAVGFYGEHIAIGHGSEAGWERFGIERRVTRSSANVLYELDGKPALQLYKEYLGDRAAGLPSTALLFPLALRESQSDEKAIIRTVLSVDEDTQSMTFAGDIPQGYRAQLMKANFDRLIEGAAAAADRARASGDGEMLCIAISCVGRRLILGQRLEEELEATLEKMPAHTRQVGFYSYGEISPSGGYCDLHNQTMTITTIRETEYC